MLEFVYEKTFRDRGSGFAPGWIACMEYSRVDFYLVYLHNLFYKKIFWFYESNWYRSF